MPRLKKMTVIANLIAHGLAGGSDERRHARAWSMLGTLIGGINIARALHSANASDGVAQTIIAAAIKAAGRTRTPPE